MGRAPGTPVERTARSSPGGRRRRAPAKSAKRRPEPASNGITVFRNNESARRASWTTRSPINVSCALGVSPSTDSVTTPPSTTSLRPATRNWKNSSRFCEKIARNFARSSGGVSSSSASARTRELKTGYHSSRFVNVYYLLVTGSRYRSAVQQRVGSPYRRDSS